MTNVFRRFGSRIKNKLALLSVIPVAVVTLVITWHTIETSREQINSFQLHTATQLAKNLATISDFALYSNRKDLLEPLVASASDIPVIADIVYLTPDRTLLLDNELPATVTEDMLLRSDYSKIAEPLFVVEEPVYSMDVDISDFDSDSHGEKTLLGWVVVIADNTSAIKNTQENLITQLLISFTVLLGAILLSYILSINVVSPITKMTETVRELERGNLKARITPSTGDELAILANGINHLAKAVAEGRENLETKVELATERLRKTLDDLQRKNRELDAARTEAENASAAKGDFLAQMSHELRTPITAIQGFVNLLNGAELQPSQQRYCTIIHQASKQLLQLIDDILDFTRLQSNALELDGSPFNLAECVETPLSLMASNAHDKGLELVLDISPSVPYELHGDSLRLRQIIYNLIANAIKFTPSGHVCLAVTSRPVRAGKILLILRISDTGIGIRDKDQAKLFEAFSQADNSISRRFGGSGLGLSIVKRLVALMGGTLSLESTTGKGSCFTLEIPLDLQPNANPVSVQGTHAALLFDACPKSRQALEHRLSRFANTIESCEDFTDLEISDSHRAPDVIIYSAPIDYLPLRLEQDIARLRHLYACPIVVLAPATSGYRELDGRIIDRLQPVSIIDKPPLSADLERLFALSSGAAAEAPRSLSEQLKARILIAEDNEFTRILLAAYFEGSQCHLVMAINGQEAIDQCSRQHFDLVLMDVHMPGVNGLTALQIIRQEEGPNQRTPVIMLTADILQQEENALFDAGASDLVFKPINETKLISSIQKHLNTQLAMPAGAATATTKTAEQRKLFGEEIARLTNLAKESLTDKNEELLRDAIHQLLGIAGVYRMQHLERAVQALHQAIKAGSGNTMFAALETLEHEVEQLLQVEVL